MGKMTVATMTAKVSGETMPPCPMIYMEVDRGEPVAEIAREEDGNGSNGNGSNSEGKSTKGVVYLNQRMHPNYPKYLVWIHLPDFQIILSHTPLR